MNRSDVIKKGKKIGTFLLGIPLTIAAFYFIALFLWKSRDTIISAFLQANYMQLSLGILFFALFFFLKNIIWIKILHNLGARDIDQTKSFFLLSFSETKRYIPGNIFAFVSRVKSYTEANIPAKLLVKSIVIEQMLLMLPSIVVSIPGFLFIYPRLIQEYPQYTQYVLPATILLLVCALTVVVTVTIIAKKKLNVDNISVRHILSTYFDLFLLSMLSWTFFGIGNYLVATSVHVLDPRYFLEFVSFFILTWFIGYVSILTPMGLGVREGVMILGLSPFAPLSITTLIALFSRICFMIGEFLFLGASFLLYSSKPVQKAWKWITSHAYTVILWVCIAAYAAYFTFVSFDKYFHFFMGKFDLGNMDQTVWNTLHGRIFLFTDPDSVHTVSRLAYHADFILILLSPLYLIWSDPRMLLALQSIVLALGAFFVFKIASQITKKPALALVLALIYLLNPMVQRQNLYDFHAVTLATTFLLAAWYFMIMRQMWKMTIFLVLAVLTKENIYLTAGIFGLYLILKKEYKFGIPITLASISLFFLIMKKLIPDARGGSHFALSYLSDFGDSTIEIAKNILLHPLKTGNVFAEHNGLGYLFKILFPLGFLSLAAPLFLVFSSADIAKNILSSNGNFRDLSYQYNAEIIPFLFISSIYGIQWLIKKGIPVKAVIYYILFFGILGTYFYGTLPGSKYAYIDTYINHEVPYSDIHRYLQTIPESASVAATNNLGAVLSQREHIYVIPQGIKTADYILFLQTGTYAQPSFTAQNEIIEKLRRDSRYEVVKQMNKFIVFKKTK